MAYTVLPYADGPFVELSVLWNAVTPRVRRNEPPPPPGPPKITTTLAYGVGADRAPMAGNATRAPLTLDVTRRLSVRGAEIDLLGMTPEGGLRYRVIKAMPKQVDRVTMTQIVTTSTTYVPIYVPR